MEHMVKQSDYLKQSLSCNCQLREPVQEDSRLDYWLQGLGIHEIARKQVLAEGYTLEEILSHVTRDDLRRIRLKGASELRIWLAIQQQREGIACNGISDKMCTF